MGLAVRRLRGLLLPLRAARSRTTRPSRSSSGFLVGVGKNFQAVITINEYVSLATKLILGLGLCFEMPILIFFLARLGIVSERWLLAKFKYAVLIIFIIAAVITPTPDIATQCVFAFPMIGLYLLGVGVAWIFRKRDAPPASPG